jgi:CRP/FNR family transcriptional regulator, cyclic AMP receptor protein
VTVGLAGTRHFMGAGAVSAWLVPAIIFLILIVVALLGLRWIRSEHLEALRAVPLFSLLSERELLSVLGSAHAVAFASGAAVIQQGEKGKGFFVITDGTAKVTLDGDDLATLSSGSYFGEIAVIDEGPRTANIVAQTELSTLEITPAAFLRLVDREPMVARAFYEELSRRLEIAGNPVDEAANARVDRARLVELSQTLRQTQNPDWVQATPSPRRRLRFSNLFARGA